MAHRLTFKIWFDPAINGRSDYVSDPSDPSKDLEFHERAPAEALVEHWNRGDRGEPDYSPSWKGKFSVRDHVSGRPE